MAGLMMFRSGSVYFRQLKFGSSADCLGIELGKWTVLSVTDASNARVSHAGMLFCILFLLKRISILHVEAGNVTGYALDSGH